MDCIGLRIFHGQSKELSFLWAAVIRFPLTCLRHTCTAPRNQNRDLQKHENEGFRMRIIRLLCQLEMTSFPHFFFGVILSKSGNMFEHFAGFIFVLVEIRWIIVLYHNFDVRITLARARIVEKWWRDIWMWVLPLSNNHGQSNYPVGSESLVRLAEVLPIILWWLMMYLWNLSFFWNRNKCGDVLVALYSLYYFFIVTDSLCL